MQRSIPLLVLAESTALAACAPVPGLGPLFGPDSGSTLLSNDLVQMSISVFSVVYFSIDVARAEQTIANTPSERPKTKFPLSMRLPDAADGDIHY